MRNLLIIKKSLALCMAILLSFARPALAQENGAASGGNVPAASQPQGPTDPAELEAFLDGLFAKEMGF